MSGESIPWCYPRSKWTTRLRSILQWSDQTWNPLDLPWVGSLTQAHGIFREAMWSPHPYSSVDIRWRLVDVPPRLTKDKGHFRNWRFNFYTAIHRRLTPAWMRCFFILAALKLLATYCSTRITIWIFQEADQDNGNPQIRWISTPLEILSWEIYSILVSYQNEFYPAEQNSIKQILCNDLRCYIKFLFFSVMHY